MAQLKDTVVSGSLRATDTLYSTTAQFQILNVTDGNLILNSATGDSPSLIFSRGGTLTDWRILVTSGKLSFQSATNASTWTERASFADASGNFTTTGTITATSFSGPLTGNATTASQLKGYQESSPALTTAPDTGSIRYSYHVASGSTGLFDNINNANGILTLNKFEGNYDSQLGFSANGNLYYRNFNGSALDTTTTWKQIAFTDSDITGNAATATKSGISDIWLYPENSNEINFGGATSSTTIFIGYRAKDSRSIPTKFIFGGTKGTADLQAKQVYLGSGTSSYISSTTYTGTAANASAVPLTGVTGADDLKAIEALSGTSGFLKKTAANTWTLDTNTYLTSSTGVTSIEGKTGALTLADLGIVYSTDTPSSPTEGMIWLKPI